MIIYLLLPFALFLSALTATTLSRPLSLVRTNGAKMLVWALTSIAWSTIAFLQGWVTS